MERLADTLDWSRLERAADEARARAHAPYSGYRVGAALRTAEGRVFAGCNVENSSFAATICAERGALAAMVAAGDRHPVALAVITPGPVVAPPCGICRQALVEFADDLPIFLSVATPGVAPRLTSLAALLPDAFRGGALGAR